MTPQTLEELDRIKAECHSLVTKRAVFAAFGSVVPVPGLDIAVDVGLLAGMVPEISKRFGLAKEQVDEYDEATKLFVFELVRQTGAKLVARNVTRDSILSLLQKMGVKTVSKRFGRFIPVIGSVISGGIGFAAMKYLGKSHIDECYEVAKRIIDRRAQAAEEAAKKSAMQVKAALKPTAPKPAAPKPATPKPIAKKPPALKPAAPKPAAPKPNAQKPAAQKPAEKKKAAKKPVPQAMKAPSAAQSSPARKKPAPKAAVPPKTPAPKKRSTTKKSPPASRARAPKKTQ